MKRSPMTLMILTAFGAVFVASPALPTMATSMLSSTDKSFALKAAQGNAAEIADAGIAKKNSSNTAVLAFAQKMITDHGKAGKQLSAIVTPMGLTAPEALNPMQTAAHQKLETLHGAAFNSAYLHGQQLAHEKTIELFKTEASTGSNPKLVAFAKMTLPVIEGHLQMAKRDVSAMSSK